MKTRKRFLAFSLAFALTMTSLPTQFFAQETTATSLPIPSLVEAQPTTPSAIQITPNKYKGDGYEVEFKVTNKWPGAFNGEFVLTNTSNTPLENWTLKFNLDHEITNMWNAQIVTHEANSYMIKNMGHNQDIAPGSSVNIGFQANWNDEINIPESYDLLIAKQEVGDKDYAIDFKVTSDWGQAFNGEISVTNNTEKNIEDWTLEFDFARNIERFWTAEIVEHDGEHYVIKNAGYNANIAPGQTITLGFAGNPGNVDKEPTNYVLNQLGQEIDFKKDTDKDGVPDWFEKELGTNPNKVDTDGDVLPDGYEYFILETDPLKVDSDDNGIGDGDEDIDEDGLANIKEYELETNPFIADTDKDSLLDGDEVYKYSTNPLLFDTDNDEIGDGDEIELSLDPNNPNTFGVPDSTYTVWQVAKEDVLKNINDENNIYQLSVSLLASNNVQNYLACQTSSYSASLQDNRAILGEPVELLYEAGKVKEATITFDLNSEYLETRPNYYPELNLGLDRYCVFTYNKELNLLYPIETTYSVETNTLSASVNTIGTFCVIDLESLIYDLGIDISDIDLKKESKLYTSRKFMSNIATDTSGNEVVDNFEDLSLEEMKAIVRDISETQTKNVETTQSNMLRAATLSTIKQVDLVLVLDTTGSMGSQIGNVKANLVQLISDLRKEGISLYVSIVDYKDITCDGINSTRVNYPKNSDFLNNTDDMLDVLNRISVSGGGDGPETVIDGLGATTNLKFRKNANKYAFVITDADYKANNNYGIASLSEVAKKLNNLGVKSSVVTYSGYDSIYSPLYSGTDGIWINISATFSTDMYNFILQKTNQGAKYNAIVASGLVPVVLDAELTKGGEVDTDEDGISDSDEVNWEYIKMGVDTDGSSKIILPTIKTLLNGKLGYSTEGLEKVPLLNLILQIKVLPINSSPISEDSDGDFYKDSWDINPLKNEPMIIYDESIIDTDYINKEYSNASRDMSINSLRHNKKEKISDADLVYLDPFVPKQPNKGLANFTRTTSIYGTAQDYIRFEITPKQNSDYKFTIGYSSNRKFCTMKVYKGNSTNERDRIMPNEDGNFENSWHYTLQKGTKYTIYVLHTSSKSETYTFSAEQDNWIKSYSGGVFQIDSFNHKGERYTRYYLGPELTAVYTEYLLLPDKDKRAIADNARFNLLTVGGSISTTLTDACFPKSVISTSGVTQLTNIGIIGLCVIGALQTDASLKVFEDFKEARNDTRATGIVANITESLIDQNPGFMRELSWDPWYGWIDDSNFIRGYNYINKYYKNQRGTFKEFKDYGEINELAPFSKEQLEDILDILSRR